MARGFRSTSRQAISILFGKSSGQEMRLDGTDYFIMKEDDVLAVLERSDRLQQREEALNGKTDCVRRCVAAGHSPRGQ